jgi:hypothetical protein
MYQVFSLNKGHLSSGSCDADMEACVGKSRVDIREARTLTTDNIIQYRLLYICIHLRLIPGNMKRQRLSSPATLTEDTGDATSISPPTSEKCMLRHSKPILASLLLNENELELDSPQKVALNGISRPRSVSLGPGVSVADSSPLARKKKSCFKSDYGFYVPMDPFER